jgi:hypothetical protein
MKLLILSPDYSKRVNWGHQHIRDALLKEFRESIQYGEGCDYKGNVHLPEILEDIEVMGKPDVILFENWKNMRKYTGVKEVDALKVYMVCDYYPDSRGHFTPYNQQLNDFGIDIAICPTPDVVKNIRDQKKLGNLPESLKSVFITQGVDTNIFKQRRHKKEYDVMAVFGLVSYVYPMRPAVQQMIKKLNLNTLIGDWKTGVKHFEYAEAISKSKIFVCSNGLNSQVLMKYYEVMASGTLLLTNTPKNCGSYGFKPGEHFATWNGLNDLKRKIYYYLDNPRVMDRIAKKGMKLVREKFSTEKIAKDIRNAIELYYNGKPKKSYSKKSKKEDGKDERSLSGYLGE